MTQSFFVISCLSKTEYLFIHWSNVMNKVIRIYCKRLIIAYLLIGLVLISSIASANSVSAFLASNYQVPSLSDFLLNEIYIINKFFHFTDHVDTVKGFITEALLRTKTQVAMVGVPDSEEWILLLAGLGLVCVQILNNSRNS